MSVFFVHKITTVLFLSLDCLGGGGDEGGDLGAGKGGWQAFTWLVGWNPRPPQGGGECWGGVRLKTDFEASCPNELATKSPTLSQPAGTVEIFYFYWGERVWEVVGHSSSTEAVACFFPFNSTKLWGIHGKSKSYGNRSLGEEICEIEQCQN